MRIGLFQCELTHTDQAPHLAMMLYAADLEADGHEVQCAMVHASALDAWALDLQQQDYGLVVVDSIFPFALLERLRQRVRAPLLVGGHAALQHILRGPVDLAILLGGRGPMRALSDRLRRLEQTTGPLGGEALAARWFTAPDDDGGRRLNATGQADLGDLPNLWFHQPDGTLSCSSAQHMGTPESELVPFTPKLGWTHFGPPRDPAAELHLPSVVAEMGCLWDAPARRNPVLAQLEPQMPDAALSPTARATIKRDYLDRAAGCSFCVFRFQAFQRPRRADGIQSLVEQIGFWLSQGARGVSLQAEHPLPWLVPLFQALTAAGLQLHELHVRTIPWLLLRKVEELDRAIEAARDHGCRLAVTQVGFESFDDDDLELFNKGLSGAENRAAARLLADRTATHQPHFNGTWGHGLLLLHPWTTVRSLTANLEAIEQDAPFMLGDLGPDSRLSFYSEVTPLYWKAAREGLLIEGQGEFGWGWRFADPRIGQLAAAWSWALHHARQRSAARTRQLLERHRNEPALAEAQRQKERRALLKLRPQLLRTLLTHIEQPARWRAALSALL